MNKIIKKIVKGGVTLLPVAAAILAVGYLVSHRPGPEKKQEQESVTPLRVIHVPSVGLVPRAIGFGVAQPDKIWEAVSEVPGTVLALHPCLKSGEMIPAETVLIQIDPREYTLAIDRLTAGIEEIKAGIEELDETRKNTEKLLAIEAASLVLAEKSFERIQKLLKNNAASRDNLDREKRTMLQQQQTVQQLRNSLGLIPSKKKALNSAFAMHQADLGQARINLAKTCIKAPMDCRIGDVNMDAGQFVRAGQLLFKAHSTRFTEIDTRFPMDTFLTLLDKQKIQQFRPGVSPDTFKNMFHKMKVLVRLQSGDWSAQWNGRIDRWREDLDHQTREIRVVVVVDDPYEQAIPGIRPPLTGGMFCRVELQGPIQKNRLVIPRSAVRNNNIFIVDSENRLQKREIQVAFVQSEFAVVKSGLSEGEMVVVSAPAPAIIGMKISPVPDESLRHHLKDESQAKRMEQ